MSGARLEPPEARDPERQMEATTRVVLRPLASPLALGFIALATGTLTLAGLNLGWLPLSDGAQVAIVILAFTVPLQALAAVIGFLARDGVVATGMGVLAGIWLATGLILQGARPGSTSEALGLFLVASGGAMLIPASGAALGKLIPALVLATAALRFLVTGVYQITGNATWEEVAGYVGVTLAVLALYTALAAHLEDVTGRTVLPLGRHGPGLRAVQGDLTSQARDLSTRAGVRSQL